MYQSSPSLTRADDCLCRCLRDIKPMPADERLLLAVSGMNDNLGVAVVRDALMSVSGVSEVRCDIPSQSVWVRCLPAEVKREHLPMVVAEKGFPSRLVDLGKIRRPA